MQHCGICSAHWVYDCSIVTDVLHTECMTAALWQMFCTLSVWLQHCDRSSIYWVYNCSIVTDVLYIECITAALWQMFYTLSVWQQHCDIECITCYRCSLHWVYDCACSTVRVYNCSIERDVLYRCVYEFAALELKVYERAALWQMLWKVWCMNVQQRYRCSVNFCDTEARESLEEGGHSCEPCISIQSDITLRRWLSLHLLLQNNLANFNQTWQIAYLGEGPNEALHFFPM